MLKVITDSDHALYDARVELPVDEAMVRSIMHHGVIEPIIVKKDGDDIVVVDGRQRRVNAIEACKRLEAEGKPPVRVPVRFRKGDSDKDFFGVMVTANEIRKGDELLTKINKAKKLLVLGSTPEEIAINFGVGVRTVDNWLAFLDCVGSVQKAVIDERITMTAAIKLSKLSEDAQRSALAELLADGLGKGAAGNAAAAHAVAKAKSEDEGASAGASVAKGKPKKGASKAKAADSEAPVKPVAGQLPSRSPKFLKRWRLALSDAQTSHETSKADGRVAGMVRDIIAFIYSGDLKELADLPDCIKEAAKRARKTAKK
jgi:ParB family chromosome partitioning protein